MRCTVPADVPAVDRFQVAELLLRGLRPLPDRLGGAPDARARAARGRAARLAPGQRGARLEPVRGDTSETP